MYFVVGWVQLSSIEGCCWCEQIGFLPVREAINESTDPELQLHFPSSDEEILEACSKFRALSSNDVIWGCVGCIDGWLCPIIVPGDGRVASFFSGHYQKFGLNVQACVDHESRFTAFGVNAPGGMGDAVVYIRWKLSKRIQEINSRILEKTIYLIGATRTRTQIVH